MKNTNRLIEFTYTKDNGEVSKRKGVTLGYTSPKLMLIADASDIDDITILNALAKDLNDCHRHYLDNVREVLEDYDIQQKTFKVSGISNEKETLL